MVEGEADADALGSLGQRVPRTGTELAADLSPVVSSRLGAETVEDDLPQRLAPCVEAIDGEREYAVFEAAVFQGRLDLVCLIGGKGFSDRKPLGFDAQYLAVGVELEDRAAVGAGVAQRYLRLVAGAEDPAVEAGLEPGVGQEALFLTGRNPAIANQHHRQDGTTRWRDEILVIHNAHSPRDRIIS